MKNGMLLKKLIEAIKDGTVDIQTDGRSQLVIYTGVFEASDGSWHEDKLPAGMKGVDD